MCEKELDISTLRSPPISWTFSNTTFRKLVETYRIPYQNFLGKSRVNYFRVDHLKQLKNASESQLEKLAKEEITIDDLLVKENTPD